MRMTRATSGPVRCPWCARPVSDGPERPEVCPSCGVPLARPTDTLPRRSPASASASRARQAQRLRSIAAVLGLTSVILLVAAIPLAISLAHQDHADDHAKTNLVTVLRAAEKVKLDTGQFTGAVPVVLQRDVFGISVLDSDVPSTTGTQISMMIAGDGWYGAVRSTSGRCYAAATLGGDPKIVTAVLAGNCTGDAARAALAPLAVPSGASMTAGPSSPSSPAASGN